jgi:hypothetical protein
MNRPLISLLAISLAVFGSLSPAPAQAQPAPAAAAANAVIQVNNIADVIDANPGNGKCETGAGNNVCTLRAAVMEANARPGHDTILVPAGTYTLTLVAANENAALNGDLDLTGDVTIIGAGPTATIIEVNRAVTKGRGFEVHPNVTASLSGLTIRNGQNESAIINSGGIVNHGTLHLQHVYIQNNLTGGLNNFGTATLDRVHYSAHTGQHASINNTGAMTVTRSSIFDNHALLAAGGGLRTSAGGTLLVRDSTINGNSTTTVGGGLFVGDSVVRLINSTISHNEASSYGGGIAVGDYASLGLFNVTMGYNTAGTAQASHSGGGIARLPASTGSQVLMANSLLGWNRFGPALALNDCLGTIDSLGYNLVQTATDCTLAGTTTGNLSGDPLLGGLAGNGGPTSTHALDNGSKAINAGNPAGCTDHTGALLVTDQRGYFRPAGNRCDIGAFESGASIAQHIFLPMLRR